jgi:hypothetical protein
MKTLLWILVLAFLWYTGILQALMIFAGAFIMWLGAVLANIGGAI